MTEIERYEDRQVVARMDLRDPVTDSWTEVVAETSRLAAEISQTEFVPAGLRGSVPKTTAALLYGRELGLPPMTGLGSIHVISGKAGISAEIMRALILQAGHTFEIGESTGARCVMRGRRRDAEEWSTFSYTMGEAQQAGDTKNPNYRTRPAEMLLARCTTRMARAIFPDVIHGLRSVEELEDMGDPVTGEVAAAQVQQSQPRQAVRRKATRPTPRAVTAAPEKDVDQESATSSDEEDRGPRRPTRPAPRGASAAGPSEGGGTAGGDDEQTSPSPSAATTEPIGDVGDTGSSSGPAVHMDQGDADDAPVVDDRGPKINTGQRTQIQMHAKRLGIEDRQERIDWTGFLAGRPVESSKDLTRAEASDVIDKLSRCRSKDDLEALASDDGGADQ